MKSPGLVVQNSEPGSCFEQSWIHQPGLRLYLCKAIKLLLWGRAIIQTTA